MGKPKQKCITYLMTFIFLFSQNTFWLPSAKADDIELISTQSSYTSLDDVIDYTYYSKSLKDVNHPEKMYIIEAADYTAVEGMEPAFLEDYRGMDGISVLTEEEGEITWTVNIEETGLYNLSLCYYPVEGKSSDIQRKLLVDGELPFNEAANLNFSRFWDNKTGAKTVDNQGNDIRPSQVENPRWNISQLSDPQGYYTEPFEFYLSKGSHTISLVSQREPVIIRSLQIHNITSALPYEDVLTQYQEQGYLPAQAKPIRIEAESATAKSSPMLYPLEDRSSPALTPYDAKLIKVNTIGGTNWSTSGQWIEWEFEAEADGLYEIVLHVKQNFLRGTPVMRKLTIDGKTPFAEAESLPFYYKTGWRMEKLGKDNPYQLYLEKGKHTLRMEVVLGDISEYVREVETSVRNLNDIYRRIIMVTGTEPDMYRDYQLQRKLPELAGRFAEERDRLLFVAEQLKELTGQVGDQGAILLSTAQQLNIFSNDVEKSIARLSDFKSNISSVGTWLMQVNRMPLQLDTIYLIPAGDKMPKVNNSIWDRMLHEIKSLYYSFIIDYNAIGNISDEKNDKVITVWVGTGRDQANIIKVMIDEMFTSKTDTNVNLMLVDVNSLLPAILSGQGPDVAMQIGGNLPMNYALRKAVYDLRQFDDFDEVASRFNDSALVPFRFRDSCYALPETQTFPMLFYRKDILNELGIKVPETWDDVKAALSVLDKNNMEFGLPADMSSFVTLLYQTGGQLYNDDGVSTALDSDIAINAFKEWTKYYTDFTLEREYDFANRFRTGEMPMGIVDYSVYNTLQVFAPEIDGLWGFSGVPGTMDDQGNIDRSVPSGGMATVIMNDSKDPEAAWEYLKWWTSDETQTRFGRELEALMGAGARYATANIKALQQLPWRAEDLNNIINQFNNVKGVPEVPGGYFTSRNINNAFYTVVVSKAVGPREALTDQVRSINDEILNKRQELGIEELGGAN